MEGVRCDLKVEGVGESQGTQLDRLTDTHTYEVSRFSPPSP